MTTLYNYERQNVHQRICTPYLLSTDLAAELFLVIEFNDTLDCDLCLATCKVELDTDTESEVEEMADTFDACLLTTGSSGAVENFLPATRAPDTDWSVRSEAVMRVDCADSTTGLRQLRISRRRDLTYSARSATCERTYADAETKKTVD